MVGRGGCLVLIAAFSVSIGDAAQANSVGPASAAPDYVYTEAEGDTVYIHNTSSHAVRCFTDYRVPGAVKGLSGASRTVDVPAKGRAKVAQGVIYSFRITSCQLYARPTAH